MFVPRLWEMSLEDVLLSRRFNVLKIIAILAIGLLQGVVGSHVLGAQSTAGLWLGVVLVLWIGADRFQRNWAESHLRALLQGSGSLADVQRFLDHIHGSVDCVGPGELADAMQRSCPELLRLADAALKKRAEIYRLQRFVKEHVEQLTVRDDPTPAIAALRAHVWPLVHKIKVTETLDILDRTERSLARWLDSITDLRALEKGVSTLGDPSDYSGLLGLALEAAMMRLAGGEDDKQASQAGKKVLQEVNAAQVVSVGSATSGQRTKKKNNELQTENERGSACGLSCCLSN